MSASDSETETRDTNETPMVQELRQKLTLAAEELEKVKAELTCQLQQTMEVAEYAKEQSEEQRQRTQSLERELTGKWEAVRMRTELNGLRELDDVRQQFDRERVRHRRELEQQASVIAALKEELAAERVHVLQTESCLTMVFQVRLCMCMREVLKMLGEELQVVCMCMREVLQILGEELQAVCFCMTGLLLQLRELLVLLPNR